jgi:hypothetical protein
MTHIKMVLDEKVLMDGDLGDWQHKPPTAIQHLLRPGTKPQPYLQAALAAVMEAALTDRSTLIDVHTEPQGWSVRVTHMAGAAP